MDGHTLRRVGPDGIPRSRGRGVDEEAERVAREVIGDVRAGGEEALRRWATRTGELGDGDALAIDRAGLLEALERTGRSERELLERTRDRILAFARAQRGCLGDLEVEVSGGRAGHVFLPVSRAGCYVPGGRYPLPSSALMTVCAARAAGVGTVWCAGPRPSRITLAAAGLAGADGFLACGGAQAIAALAFGVVVPACDVIVGPGGRYVAAAKRLLFGEVGTEAPAGPSELLVIADSCADPGLVAADLLAQAEHDPVAVPALVARDASFADRVDAELERRLAELPEPNRTTAVAALANGWACAIGGASGESFVEAASAVADEFAPEHLELHVEDPDRFARRIAHAGALFLGPGSAEVMGDYGAGPNHCLPTGGAARFAAGLSVLAFLRARTWLRLDDPGILARDAAAFARLEGLEGHARAADARK